MKKLAWLSFKYTIVSVGVFFLFFNSCNSGEKDLHKYAAFDWFEYKGEDSIYKELEPLIDAYYNPILAGFYPDPSICRADDNYYLVNSSFSYYPGIPIFQSKDLINWKQIGYVLNRSSQLLIDTLGVSRGIFAPAISYNKGTFYLITTIVDGGGNFFVTAKDPTGPWSDPVWLPQIDGIDPSFFFDSDGKIYIVHNGPPPEGKSLYPGHRAIWMWEYNIDSCKIIKGPDLLVNGGVDITKEPIWIEGPHIYKKNNCYYLMAAEGGTDINHSEVIFRSRLVKGPYVPYKKNPILTQRHLDPNRRNPVTSTGHADMIELNGEWRAVFLACRPYEDNMFNTGRETFMLPVKWENDWPVILKENEQVSYQVKKPILMPRDKDITPLSGNFNLTDNFIDSVLSFSWNFLRTPNEKWYKIENGKLFLSPREVTIFSNGNPSFIGRRQQHLNFSASVVLNYSSKDTISVAGLIAFQNEKHYLFIGKRHTSDKKDIIFLEQASGLVSNGKPMIIAQKELPKKNSNSDIYLKIQGKGRYYSFYYKISGMHNWILLSGNVDAKILSTKIAGGFVGTYLGMYASNAHFKRK